MATDNIPKISFSDLEDYTTVRNDLYNGIAWQREISSLENDSCCNITEIVFE